MDAKIDSEVVGECVAWIYVYTIPLVDALGTDISSGTVRLIGVSTMFTDTRQIQFNSCGSFVLSFLLLLEAFLSHKLSEIGLTCLSETLLFQGVSKIGAKQRPCLAI